MKKKYIVVTGGAGFVGSNLIELLLKKTKFKIISLDNYSSGSKKTHINFDTFLLITHGNSPTIVFPTQGISPNSGQALSVRRHD